jgi:TRAP-type C4-dicarboxylate transport system permease small subunit
MKDRSHFTITILTARFPTPVRAWLDVVVALGATALLAIVIDKG